MLPEPEQYATKPFFWANGRSKAERLENAEANGGPWEPKVPKFLSMVSRCGQGGPKARFDGLSGHSIVRSYNSFITYNARRWCLRVISCVLVVDDPDVLLLPAPAFACLWPNPSDPGSHARPPGEPMVPRSRETQKPKKKTQKDDTLKGRLQSTNACRQLA